MIPPKVYSSRGWSQSFIGFSLALQVGSYGRAQACFFILLESIKQKSLSIQRSGIFWWFIARKSVVFHGLFQFGHPFSVKQWGIWAFSVAATLLARWGKMRMVVDTKGFKNICYFHIFFLLASFRSVPSQGKGQHRPRLCQQEEQQQQ